MSGKKRTSRLLIDEQPLQVIPSLAASIGVNEAILLQQINFWIKNAENSKDDRKLIKDRWWTYNTYADWQEQMPWMSVSGIRKLVGKLRDKGLIAVVKQKKHRQDHTFWYTINFEAVDTLCQSDVTQSDTSMCPRVSDDDVTQSDTSYIETENPESPSESSRRDANASQEKEEKTNWFTVWTDEMKKVNLPVADEDRERIPGNLTRCVMKESATDFEMNRLIGRMVQRRLDGVQLSPQAALGDIRGIPREASGTKEPPRPQKRVIQ